VIVLNKKKLFSFLTKLLFLLYIYRKGNQATKYEKKKKKKKLQSVAFSLEFKVSNKLRIYLEK